MLAAHTPNSEAAFCRAMYGPIRNGVQADKLGSTLGLRLIRRAAELQ